MRHNREKLFFFKKKCRNSLMHLFLYGNEIKHLMSIRKAELQDSEAIKDIAANAGYIDYISPNVDSLIKSGDLFVYLLDQEIRGICMLENTGQLWISALRVHYRYRREGIGRAILQFAVEYAKNLGLNSLGGLVESHNTSSINLFKGEGFSENGRYTTIIGTPDVHTVRKINSTDKIPDVLLLEWKVLRKVSNEYLWEELEVVYDKEQNKYARFGNFYFLLENKAPIDGRNEGFTIIPFDIFHNKMISGDQTETYEFIDFTKKL